MSRRPLQAALAAIVVAPAALAASHPSLTIYHADNDALFSGVAQGALAAGHALVHETRTLALTAGQHQIRIGGLPATLDPEAVAVGFGNGAGVSVLGQRVALANAAGGNALEGAIGSRVRVATGDPGGEIDGTLIGTSGQALLVQTTDHQVHLVQRYTAVTLPADTVATGSTLLLDVDARTSGQRDASLTYTASGLGWRAAYAATLAAASGCNMLFKPDASIANRSGRDYDDVALTLIAGQPNLGNRMRTFASAPVPMAAAARAMPDQGTLGDYRSFTLAGPVNLPNGTVTLTPLYPARTIACTRSYTVDDGNAYSPPKPLTNDFGPQDYQDRPITSTLAFTAPEALPAGTVRVWTMGPAGAPGLLGEGGIADTPKGQRAAVQLGQSFDLRASHDRTAFHVDLPAHTMEEAFKITLTNGGDIARTVTVREHPNRWREWTVAASNIKPSRVTPQLLEFEVPVPANGSATVSYTVRYTWTAADL